METWLARWTPTDVMAAFAVFGAFTVPILAIVGWIITGRRQHQQKEMELALKHEMIARGMTAGEVERVLKVSSKDVAPPSLQTDQDEGAKSELIPS
jgi:Flp pilus assembly protein TadB